MVDTKTNIGNGLVILGAILLIVSLLISLLISFESSTVSPEKYGVDAYTGIQNATAQTADAINKWGSFCAAIMSISLIGIGAVINNSEHHRNHRHNLAIHQMQMLQQSIEKLNQLQNISTPDSQETVTPVSHDTLDTAEFRFMNMKTCQACGNRVTEQTSFCNKCGKEFDAQ